jgi:integrase
LELFAGIRPAEVARLRWENIDADGGLVEIGYSTAKTRARRLVKIQPALKAWLGVCTKRTGPIFCCTKSLHSMRKDFGEWPKDVLRHSFISYELERSQSVGATALQAGNSEAIIFKHYRELVTPQAAEAFWSLRP